MKALIIPLAAAALALAQPAAAQTLYKLIAAVGTPLAGRLLLLDALSMSWREVRIPRDPHCPVCAKR